MKMRMIRLMIIQKAIENKSALLLIYFVYALSNSLKMNLRYAHFLQVTD
jgi:hypothetical protein